MSVTLDSSNKIIEGVQSNGMKYLSVGMNIGGNEYYVIENPEWIRAVINSDNKILCGIKQNGKFYANIDGIDEQVKGLIQPLMDEVENLIARFDEIFKLIDNPEYMSVELDSDDKILGGRRIDGTKFENVGIETNHLELTEQGMTDFQKALKDAGFTPGGAGDWSDSNYIQIPEPKLAYINITNNEGDAVWPTTKTTDAHYWMQFFDGDGNYFKKRIILNAQGNSSLSFSKKNGAFDVCNDAWLGDDTCNIRIGNWAICDSFHLKAYYFDFFKGGGIIAYKVANQIFESRPFNENRPWKKELLSANDKDDTIVGNPSYNTISDISLQIDDGARCIPDGFPCIVHLNGTFYGIYVWSYKKHRSNYNMDKSTPEHIHLDGGELTSRTIFGGSVDWSQFEIRNPKYLVYKNPRNSSFDPTNAKQVKKAYEYDADVAQDEIAGTSEPLVYSEEVEFTRGQVVSYKNRLYMAMQTTIGNTPTANKKPKNVYDDAATNGYWIDITYTNKVKQYIISLSGRMGQINAAQDERAELQKYFDLDNIIDYELYITLTHNIDGQGWNWQLCSWSGERWYFCVWDAERIWGQVSSFNFLSAAPTIGELLLGGGGGTPNAWVNTYCKADLKQRWEYLVSKGIADSDSIIKLFKDWMDRIGVEYFEKEYEKWPNSPCNRDSKLNKEYWKFTGNFSFTDRTPHYNEGTQYITGDKIWVGSDFHYEFECIQDTTEYPLLGNYAGEYPAELGYHDNLWRLYSYLSTWINALKEYFNNLNV